MVEFTLHIYLVLILSTFVSGSPVYDSADAIPTLSLSWGKYVAKPVDSQGDVYIYQNVRFGRSMADTLRFSKSSYPDSVPNPNLQDQTFGPGCISVNRADLKQSSTTPSGEVPPFLGTPQNEDEDCLFLDIYASANALTSGKTNIPVIVWFYGGAYIFGSKDQQYPGMSDVNVYTGTPLVRTAVANGDDVIVVIGNYRLGAYGWLAGSHVEADGYPNAGLSDQRLVLQFVQDYIAQVGGDKTQVSAWGESAGAGSIIHHLVQNGGQTDPLFSRAVLQSPAYQWMWNRTGTIDEMFKTFATNANCSGKGLDCLRSANSSAIQAANLQTLRDKWVNEGLFAFGPSVDGKLIPQLAPVAFQQGNYFKNMSSIIVSHVQNEASLFVKLTNNCTYYKDLVANSFPGQIAVQSEILANPAYDTSDCGSHPVNMVADSSFFGNTRQVIDAYSEIATVYATAYRFPLAIASFHGFDLIPTFYQSAITFSTILCNAFPDICKVIDWSGFNDYFATFSPAYQRYLVSHAVTGNPNTWNSPPNLVWGTVNDAKDMLSNVLVSSLARGFGGHPDVYFVNGTSDNQNTLTMANFWRKIANELETAAQQNHTSSPQSSSSLSLDSQQKFITKRIQRDSGDSRRHTGDRWDS